MSKVKIRLLALSITLLLLFPGAALATVVRMQTSLGVIDIDLFDESAPLTVENFLTNYVNTGAYNDSFFHRSVKNFVIQGGGYQWLITDRYAEIPKKDPVINEFSPDRSNLRGTIAMARTSELNSATSQWFFNLKDNSGDLDNPGNGYAVFGQVKESGYAVIDAIAALQIVNAGGIFSNLPLVSFPQDQILRGENLVMVHSVAVLPTVTANDSDRVFNYLEATYQQYVSPASQVSTTAYGYYFRYYPETGAYVGTANGRVYYLGPLFGDEVKDLGSVSFWLDTAIAAGY